MKTEFQPRKTHAGFKWKASAAQNAPTPVDATRIAEPTNKIRSRKRFNNHLSFNW